LFLVLEGLLSTFDSRTPSRQSVTVVVPAFNEVDCVDELASRLSQVFEGEERYSWEVLIVENGSTDGTWEKLKLINQADPRFTVIRLSRNFGTDGGLTAGLDRVNSDACILMTSDLQDPPEMIPDFLRKWEAGYANVYGVITARHGTGLVRRVNSQAFYWLADKLTDGRIPRNASDFRLLDRRAYEAIRSMQERNRFVRGLAAWVGFDAIGIPMERPARHAGSSKAYSLKVLNLALRGIFAYSYVPLRLITFTGFFASALAFLGLVGGVVLWLTRGVPFGGFGTIVSLILLLFGVLTLMIGVLSEYVALVYEEVKARPHYVVSDELN